MNGGTMRTAIVAAAAGMLAAAIGTFWFSGGTKSAAREATPASAGAAATGAVATGAGLDFTARALNGGKIRLRDYRGHPVIVDFWATWCGPCRREMPELNAIYKRYHRSKGLAVIGVACDTIEGYGASAVKPFVDELRIAYPIALADDALTDKLGIEAIPTTLFIGPDGQIVSKLIGAGQVGELTENARQLLGEAGKGKPLGAPPEAGGRTLNL